MKSFECTNCGTQVKRPTTPLRCEQCGQQRIGLFKMAAAATGGSPTPPASSKPSPPAQGVAPPTAPKPAVAPPPPPPPIAKPAAPAAPAGSGRSAPAASLKSAAPKPAPPKPAPPQTQATAPAKPEPVQTKRPAGPGAIVWRYPAKIPGQDLQLIALRNCIAVDESGTLFAAIGRNLVALQESESGVKQLWTYATGGPLPGSPCLGRDGRLRIHSGDEMLHCLDVDGKTVWTPVKVGDPLGWAAPLADEDGNTYISGCDGGVVRVDPRGGRKNTPFFRTRQRMDSTGLIHAGVLYLGGEDGFVYAIDVAAMRPKNRFDHLAGQGFTDWFINSAIALSPQQELIVAGRDEHLHGFGLDGQEHWKLHLRGQMLASPVIDAAGNIYVTVSLGRAGEPTTGRIVAVDAQSHQMRWEFRTEDAIESTPVLGDGGLIYFGDNRGKIHCLDENGQPQWNTDTGSPVRSAGAITPRGHIVFGLDDGTLVALASDFGGLASGGWPKYLGTPGQSGCC